MDHFVIYVSCLSCFHVCSLQPCLSPAGKGCFIVFLSLSHVVSWGRCGAWLDRFLNFVSLFTLIFNPTGCQHGVYLRLLHIYDK